MSNDNKVALNPLPTRKEIKKEAIGKIEFALPEMRTTLGDKKFHRRVKKAVKLLVAGIHSDDVLKKARKKAGIARAASSKKLTAKTMKKAKAVKQLKTVLPEIFDKAEK